MISLPPSLAEAVVSEINERASLPWAGDAASAWSSSARIDRDRGSWRFRGEEIPAVVVTLGAEDFEQQQPLEWRHVDVGDVRQNNGRREIVGHYIQTADDLLHSRASPPDRPGWNGKRREFLPRLLLSCEVPFIPHDQPACKG